MVVLDSTFLIAVERADPEALELLAMLGAVPLPLRVPAAVWIEYLAPFKPTQRAKSMRTLEAASVFEPVTREIADVAARLQHELRREGRPLPWHDLQIASTALHHGEELVSNDARFKGIPGLSLLEH